ncbi:MAG: hypothetical protein R3F39_15605 [Myxococcota bacterium]
MSPGSLQPTVAAGALVVSLDSALFDLRPALAAALAAALLRYRAIAGARPTVEALLEGLPADACTPGHVLDLGVAVLRALAAGRPYPPRPDAPIAPDAAVDRAVLARLVAECWLGGSLYAALTDTESAAPAEAGHIHDARPRPDGLALLRKARAASRPTAIITALPGPEALYLLAGHGMTAAADQVVTTDPAQRASTPRVVEALERLGVAEAELHSAAPADHAQLADYMSSRMARLSKRV